MTGRRPPVLVVQTDDEPGSLARRLAATSSNAAPGTGEPIRRDQLDALAAQRIDAELADRRRRHRERTAELTAAVEIAATNHAASADAAEATADRRKLLLDGALWCEGRRGFVAEQTEALRRAEAEHAAALTRCADADAAVEAAAAAEARRGHELEAAQRELIAIDAAGRSEEELHRALTTAREAALEAASAADAARQGLAALRDRLDAAERRAADARATLETIDTAVSADPAPVVAALARLDAAPLVPADPAAHRLARDLQRLTTELASLPPAGPAPDDAEVESAEVAATEAHARLEALRRPAPPHEAPPWWDELARLHAAVVDAESAAGHGFRAKAGRKRLEEALAAERAFLDEIGYPSHLDALMSGGRPVDAPRPGPFGIAQAEDAVVEAERLLFELRAAAAAAADHKRLRADLARVRALASALLGIGLDRVRPEQLRAHRPDPEAVAALRAALVDAGVNTRSGGLAETARTWLAARQQADQLQPELAAEAADADRAALAAARAVEVAEADAAQYIDAAALAERRVASLTDELAHRAEVALDPEELAARADATRARIAELEAGAGSTAASAGAEADAAREALAGATERRDAAAAELAAVAARAAELAAALDPDGLDPAADLGDLGDLSVALRAAVATLDLTMGEAGRAVALAAAGLAAARAALAGHQATAPQHVTAVDVADALAEALRGEARTTDVVVEPGVGFGPDGWEILLDELGRLGAERPVAVVTADLAFASWAATQPRHVVEVVPGRVVDPGPSTADRIDRAEAR